MKDGDKFFGILMGLCLLLGVGGAAWMFVQEMLARAALSNEMRTPEMIQRHYDGAVCLSCETMGIALLFLGLIAAAFVMIFWGVYRLTSKLVS